MQLRYDIGEKLDLSKFRKQATHYILKMRQIDFLFYLQDYKIYASISSPDGESTSHFTTISIDELTFKDDEIVNLEKIYPLNDLRFKSFANISNIFVVDFCEAHFDSSNINETLDKICFVINITHRINNLKIFL